MSWMPMRGLRNNLNVLLIWNPRLYYTIQEVLDYNHKQLRDLGLPVKKVRADHTGVEAAKASSDVAEGLHTEVDIAIGARIMGGEGLGEWRNGHGTRHLVEGRTRPVQGSARGHHGSVR